MTTYNTGNPIGSAAVKDLFDNAENLDVAVNSPTANVWSDRLGQPRKTWRGIENEAQLEIAHVVGQVTAQSQGYLDATIVARDEARAAASASGPIAFYSIYAAAQAAAGGLPAGAVIEVSQDETRDGARTRYKVQAGALVFMVNLDQLRLDLANPSDPAAGAEIVIYLPAGVGAVAQTVRGKLSEAASSKDMGALGGSNDDTDAIQRLFSASATRPAIVNTVSRISVPITVPTGARIVFSPGAKLIPTARFFGAIKATGVNDWAITDPCIEGLAGVATDVGIDIDGCSNWAVIRPKISGLGLGNPVALSQDDAFHGAHGICIACTSGNTDNGLIDQPVISMIGGNGNVRGDGISINGSYFNALYRTSNIKVTSPKITKTARHGMAVEGPSTNMPNGVSITDPVISFTGLSGIDIEDAENVTVEGRVRLSYCGNDQTFYNPVATYGAAFGLMSGFSVQNSGSFSNTLKGDVIIDNCRYGIQTGSSNGTTLDGVVCRNSVVADWLGDGLAQSATRFRMTNCRMESLVGSTALYRSGDLTVGGMDLKGNYFARPLTLRNYANAVVNGKNTFARGLSIVFAASADAEVDDNVFLDFAGNQLSLGITNDLIPRIKVRRNWFQFGNNVQSNIITANDGIKDSDIEGNQFDGALVANVSCGFGQNALRSYSGNAHNLAPYGLTTPGGMVGVKMSDNTFKTITLWCVNFNELFSPLTLDSASIADNKAIAGCGGGLRVNLTSGAWDFNTILGNNWRGCSGVHQALPGVGNAGGLIANNI